MKASDSKFTLWCCYMLQKMHYTCKEGNREAKCFLGVTSPKAKEISHLAYGSFVLSSPQSKLRFMYSCV